MYTIMVCAELRGRPSTAGRTPPQGSLTYIECLNFKIQKKNESKNNFFKYECWLRLRLSEGDGKSLGTESSSTSNSVEVGIRSTLADGHVVVEDDVDLLDVDSTTEDLGGD